MPAKSQSRRNTPLRSEASSPSAAAIDEQSADWRGLKIFLRQTIAFRLALALYNDPVARDGAIRSLREELAASSIRLLTLDLRDPAAEHTLLGRVEKTVKDASVAPGEELAVMVVNLESQIDYTPELAQPGGPGTAFLETANLHRELFLGVCPGPLILWMTELLERALVSYAPDFWHWRSHTFDLRTRVPLQVDERIVWPGEDRRRHPEDRLGKLEEELSAYRALHSPFDEGRVLNAIGVARLDMGDARNARRDFEAALNVVRQLDNKYSLRSTLGNLGNACTALGEWNEAIKFHEQALAISLAISDRLGEGNALGNLGNVYLAQGDVRKAIEFHGRHLAVARAVEDKTGESNALGNLGAAYSNLGEWHKSIEFHERGLAISREIGDRLGESIDLGGLANVYAELGDLSKSLKLHEQELAICREVGDQRGEGESLWNAALVFIKLGDHRKAVHWAEQALTIMELLGHPSIEYIRSRLTDWRRQSQ